MHIELKSAFTPNPKPAPAPGSAPLPTAARKRRRTSGERLIEALLELAQGKATVARHTESSWASITFAGTRHRVELQFEGTDAVEAGECLIAFLPEHEFAIPGQLVADAAVVAVDHVAHLPRMLVTAELLLLEEG